MKQDIKTAFDERKTLKPLPRIGSLLVLASCLGCAPPQRTVYSVNYRVSGTARTAEVTYSVPGGGTDQRTVAVPYLSPPYKFPLGRTVFVQAKNQGASGDLYVEIMVNGWRVPGWEPGNPAGQSRYTAKPYGVARISWGVGMR